jgi:hypothetical protein
MKVSLWNTNDHWFYTVCDDSRPIIKKESGDTETLGDALKEIENLVNNFQES